MKDTRTKRPTPSARYFGSIHVHLTYIRWYNRKHWLHVFTRKQYECKMFPLSVSVIFFLLSSDKHWCIRVEREKKFFPLNRTCGERWHSVQVKQVSCPVYRLVWCTNEYFHMKVNTLPSLSLTLLRITEQWTSERLTSFSLTCLFTHEKNQHHLQFYRRQSIHM